MKITNTPANVVQGTEQARATEKSENLNAKNPVQHRSVASETSSQVQISDQARLMNQAMQTAKNAPDMRADRVAEIKEAILNGSYRVSGEDVADRLLENHLGIHFGKNSL